MNLSKRTIAHLKYIRMSAKYVMSVIEDESSEEETSKFFDLLIQIEKEIDEILE